MLELWAVRYAKSMDQPHAYCITRKFIINYFTNPINSMDLLFDRQHTNTWKETISKHINIPIYVYIILVSITCRHLIIMHFHKYVWPTCIICLRKILINFSITQAYSHRYNTRILEAKIYAFAYTVNLYERDRRSRTYI